MTVLHILGLGGTSLLNGNIFLHADKKTLSMDDWHPDIKNNPEVLNKCKVFLSQQPYIFNRADSRMQITNEPRLCSNHPHTRFHTPNS